MTGALRKHYLDGHTTGLPVLLAAEAYSAAARTEGLRVEIVDGHAVTVLGDPPPGMVEAFAGRAAQLAEAASAAPRRAA